MHSHLPSCWVVLYLTTWWPPSPWRLILASFALFHFCLGLRGWRGLARPTRPLQGSDLSVYLALSKVSWPDSVSMCRFGRRAVHGVVDLRR